MLLGVLVVVFVVVAVVNATVAVADAVLWPVVMALWCVAGATVVGRVHRVRRRPGRGLDIARRILTEGLGHLPEVWPDDERSRDELAPVDNSESRPRDLVTDRPTVRGSRR